MSEKKFVNYHIKDIESSTLQVGLALKCFQLHYGPYLHCQLSEYLEDGYEDFGSMRDCVTNTSATWKFLWEIIYVNQCVEIDVPDTSVKINTCFCKSDLCNGGNSIVVNMKIILFLAIVCYFFYFLK